MRDLYLRLECIVGDQRISQCLTTSGDLFDPNVVHVLHFQLDALVKGMRTAITELREVPQ